MKKEKFVAQDVKRLSHTSLSPIVSTKLKSSYAKLLIHNNPNLKFKSEWYDESQGKHFVKTLYPGRAGKFVKVVWGFNPRGEAMRNAAVQRAARRTSGVQRIARKVIMPRSKDGIVRFPRSKGGHVRFPRTLAVVVRKTKKT